MAITLTILGSSSALPTSDRYTSAHVLNVHEHLFLIDCGEGTQMRFRQLKLHFNKLDRIFISHLHGDHFFGIFGLLSTLQLLGRKNELHIYSFSGLEELIKGTQFGEEFTFPIIFHNLQNNKKEVIYSDKKIEVTAFPLNHRIPTCGFVFREKPKLLKILKEKIQEFNIPVSKINDIKNGNDFVTEEGKVIPNKELTLNTDNPRTYAYCSDTIYSPEIIPYINGVNLLYHEATFLENLLERANTTFHSTASQAAEIAKAAKVEKLIIGHYSVRYKELDGFLTESREVFPETYLANDGLQFEV
ncbi:MAG: ribonuclease Z [Bacteroidia bacterium]|nr:ribonuclease Z [Bacteroidia bacterium]